MKKQLLLPLVAVVLAVSGAYASNKFAPIFYAAGVECEGTGSPIPTCNPSDVTLCTQEGTDLQYYYKPEPSSDCTELYRD